MKLFKFLLGVFIFFLAFSIALAAYESFNNGPWYMYINEIGDKVVIGQNVRTTYQVYDEDGNLIDTVPGWKFEDEAPNALVKDSAGELHYMDPLKLPEWIEITNFILKPFLTVGHFIVDNVVYFVDTMK